MPMLRYKILVAYDGSDYYGWQWQPDRPTIVGVLQSSFTRAFYQNIHLVGASRTDTGVHALGQVAHFATDLPIDAITLHKVWQRQLPSTIVLRSLSSVDENFHSQRQVRQKTYYYHIFLQRPLPCSARYGWYYDVPIDLDALERCLMVFVGTHDFRSFCTGYEREDTIRTIDDIKLSYVPSMKAYRIVVRGPGFLRYMIRRIIGASVVIASTKRSINELTIALQEKNPQQNLFTAPAHGLLLRKVCYTDGRNV
jgi:tRNA pseudouridine38-40 synthase